MTLTLISRFLHRLVGSIKRGNYRQRLRIRLGLEETIRAEDRRILEQIIIPKFMRDGEQKDVLFVGCSWYTRHYKKWFDSEHYWTIDQDPVKQKYGAKKHFVCSVEVVNWYFTRVSLDLIICNGVFGWGLNVHSSCSRAFRHCFDILRPGGKFVLGWNQQPKRMPFDPEKLMVETGFKRLENSPLGQWRYEVPGEGRHTYDFYVKPWAENKEIL